MTVVRFTLIKDLHTTVATKKNLSSSNTPLLPDIIQQFCVVGGIQLELICKTKMSISGNKYLLSSSIQIVSTKLSSQYILDKTMSHYFVTTVVVRFNAVLPPSHFSLRPFIFVISTISNRLRSKKVAMVNSFNFKHTQQICILIISFTLWVKENICTLQNARQ